MDLYVAFMSMFLLAFGLTALGLGLFSTYFGAGKSRAIGVILSLIGIVVLLIFYLLTIDHFGYGWMEDDVSDSFLGVIGMLIGIILSIVLVIGLMVVIKEDEPAVPGTKDWEKDLAVDDSTDDGPVNGDEEKADEDGSEGDEPEEDGEHTIAPAGIDQVSDTVEEKKDEVPETESEPKDDMTEFLKDKEEKKIVKEDWEKVDEEGSEIPDTDDEPDIPAPEEVPEDPSEEEPPAPPEEEPEMMDAPETPAPEEVPDDDEAPDREADPDPEDKEIPEEEPEKKEGE